VRGDVIIRYRWRAFRVLTESESLTEDTLMRWKDGRRSDNIEDIRGERGPRMAGMGAGAAPLLLLRIVPMLFRSKGGRALLVIGVLAFFGLRMLGIDPLALMQPGASQGSSLPAEQHSAAEQELADFVSVTLADTEDTWGKAFASMGQQYEKPYLVLFTDAVRSACGNADAAVGPFYCGADRKVYLDLSFFDQLRSRHDAPGDFAQAYVIAHEIGHHVQNLLGISEKVIAAGRGQSQETVNQLSVRQELQADCFAGYWGHQANKERAILESGDLEEALAAASAIGDDRLQRESRGRVVPDSFTHGSSEQRVRWFKRGFEGGDLSQCDTFGADNP
jgi:predicted metalloprotease